MVIFSQSQYLDCVNSISSSDSEKASIPTRSSWGFWLPASLLLFMLAIIPVSFKQIYFRDYAIVYDAAYRIGVLGHEPFKDFGLPTGAVSFYLPALAFYFFGPSWFVLMFVQIAINAMGLIALGLIANRLGLDKKLSLAILIAHVCWFTWPNLMPWYNTTAYVLQLWSVYFVLTTTIQDTQSGRLTRHVLVLASSLFTALSILSKQDFGLLSMILNCCLLVVALPKTRAFYFVTLYVICSVGFFFINSIGLHGYQFLDWFNFGFPPHESRLSLGRLAHVILQADWRHLLITIAIIWYIVAPLQFLYMFKRHQLAVILAIGFCLQSFVTSMTSGLPVSHLYYMPWILLIVLSIVHTYTSHRLLLVSLLSVVLFTAPVLPDIFTSVNGPKLLLTWGQGWSEGNPLEGNNQRLYNRSPIAVANNYWPEETINGFDDLISDTKLALQQRPDARFKLLNFSEFTFVHYLLNTEPVKGLPLWFDQKATFFEPEVSNLATAISQREFAAIWFQEPHSQLPEKIKQAIIAHYDKVLVMNAPAEGKPITLFVSKP